MHPVSAALDARLGKLTHWGDTRFGIQMRKRPCKSTQV